MQRTFILGMRPSDLSPPEVQLSLPSYSFPGHQRQILTAWGLSPKELAQLPRGLSPFMLLFFRLNGLSLGWPLLTPWPRRDVWIKVAGLGQDESTFFSQHLMWPKVCSPEYRGKFAALCRKEV